MVVDDLEKGLQSRNVADGVAVPADDGHHSPPDEIISTSRGYPWVETNAVTEHYNHLGNSFVSMV